MDAFPLVKLVSLGLILCNCIPSCTTKRSQENALYQSVIENLELSNKVILADTYNRIHKFEQDLESPMTSTIALNWKNKLLFVRNKVRAVLLYVDTLKSEIGRDRYLTIDQSASLQNRVSLMLKNVKDSIAFDFQPCLMDTLSEKDFYERNFPKYSGVASQELGLARIENTLRHYEYSVVVFCTSQYCKLNIVYDQYHTLVGQSSTIVRPGDNIEITAGMGAYTNDVKPIIKINDKSVNVDSDGRAQYFIKASKMVGHYTAPVKIIYYDAKGKLEVRDFTINWEVRD